MKKTKLRITGMAIILCLSSNAAVPAHAQLTEVAGSVGTGMLIEQISGELNGLIDNARQSGDFLAMRASQEARSVLESFKRANLDILDDAFNKIGKERQAVLNALRQTTYDIERGRVDTLDRLQTTSDQLDRLVRDTTFKNHPTIYRYRGSVITPGETQDIRLTINGFKLTRGEPFLTFNGQRYRAQIEGETLRFVLPRSAFEAAPSQIKSETAALTVFYKSGAILGIGGSTKEVKYDINFVTLPSKLASVEVSYRAEVKIPKHETWRREESHKRSGHGGWKCKGFAFSPSRADRLFDPASSSVKNGSGNSEGKIEDIRIRDVGISFEICAKRGWSSGGPGYRHAIVNATEVWTEMAEEPQNNSADLSWTANAAVSVAPRLNSLLIKIKDFTGHERTVAATGGTAGRYVTVTYDRDSNVVLVNPIIPTDLNAL